MRDVEIYKAFGQRMKDFRKQKKWTQKELADKLDIRFSQLNKYESGLHIPPVDKLIQIAELFETTIDYLLTGNRTEEIALRNSKIMERFKALEDFPALDQETVINVIDAMIIKHRVENVFKPISEFSR